MKVSNVPNAVGGPIAHKPSRFSKTIKLNKKELSYLKENALSVLLRRKSTRIIDIPEITPLKLKNSLDLLFKGTPEKQTIIVTENLLLYSSLANHPKVDFIKGLQYNRLLKGGIKDKTIIFDEKLLYPFLLGEVS